jgi:hypothetical protein
MAVRKAMSKKLRFSIFERDNFTCQYCGKTPPDVMLNVDHIVPVSKGGTDDPENLRTSCFECNSGKGAKRIKVGVNTKDGMRRAQEALETVLLAKEFCAAKKARDEMREHVTGYLCSLTGRRDCVAANVTGIINAISEFSPEKVMTWLDKACQNTGGDNYPSERDLMCYFYGILRNVRAES